MANIRTIDYSGSNAASDGTGPKGWMFWSGSTTVGGQAYSGLGMELMDTSESYLKFTTEGDGDLDIRAKKFYVGTPSSQFISGSGGDIEISSSNFHLKADGGLIIGGDTVINANISVNSLFVPAGTTASNAKAYIDQFGDAKFVGDGTGAYVVDFSTGSAKIAGFDITSTAISASGLHLSSSGDITGSQVKFTGGDIAGWTLSADKITGGKLILDKDGKIYSEGYQSSPVPLGGTGFMLSVDDGTGASFLEVENARIRGTLSTAVFEKETVNAVGGQLIVANSTTLSTSSLVAPADNTMSVMNVSGFEAGEILIAKKVTSNGFNTEYLYVDSASRHDSTSETDFSGNLYVQRGYTTGDTATTSGSLPGIAGTSQSYSGSQVLVSTGKIGTGFIHMNANPNDLNTPYIDIVERTGSGLYDAKKVARLGDLSGIEDTINGQAVSGYGLYTDNAFLKGGIVATYGSIGALDIDSQSISIGGKVYGDPGTKFFVTSSGNFSLGDKLTWNSGTSTLNVSGDISVTNTGDFANPNATVNDFPDETNLFAYFPLHGSVTTPEGFDRVLDFSGNARHGDNDAGSISGGTTFVTGTAAGPLPGAAQFDGTDSRIDLNQVALDLTSNMDISISFWMKKTTTGMEMPFGIHDDGDNEFVFIVDHDGTNNQIELRIGSTVLGTITVTTKELTDAWTHIGLVCEDEAQAKLYIDGVLEGNFTDANANTANIATADEMLLGGELDDGEGAVTDDFTGFLSEFRLYSSVLTADNMLSLYNMPTGPPSSTNISGNQISTGKLVSTNFSSAVGSEIDLDAGTIKLGGYSSPAFNVNASGVVTASAGLIGGWELGATKLSTGGFEIAASGSNDYAISSSGFTVNHNGLVAAANFAEKFVTVTADNSGSYFENDLVAGGNSVRLILDGSKDGEVTMNLQLEVPPVRDSGAAGVISDIKFPYQGTDTKMEATIVIACEGVKFDNAEVMQDINSMAK